MEGEVDDERDDEREEEREEEEDDEEESEGEREEGEGEAEEEAEEEEEGKVSKGRASYWTAHVDEVEAEHYQFSAVLYFNTAWESFTGGAFAFRDVDADRIIEPR